mgnify:FL=1
METRKTTAVSIIVPVYNKEKYLSECVDSILRQNFKDFELILVDDGSKDSSWNIIKEYANKDKRVVPVHQENAGVSAARNAGLDRAQGKWICFVDADDYLPKDGIQILVEHGEKSNADIVNANATRVEDDKQFKIFNFNNEIVKGNIYPRLVHFAPWAQLFKRSIIEEHHLRYVKGLAYSEDNVFILYYSLYASSIEFVNDSVYNYRINSDSAIQNKDYKKVAYHQMWAAHEVYKLKDKESSLRNFIINRTKILISSSINAYVYRAINVLKINDIIRLYSDFFKETNMFHEYIIKATTLHTIKLLLKFK